MIKTWRGDVCNRNRMDEQLRRSRFLNTQSCGYSRDMELKEEYNRDICIQPDEPVMSHML